MTQASELVDIALTVNGQQIRRNVRVRVSLADFLRHELGLTGTHLGCEHGVCGACTVRVDAKIVRGCLMLAVQADGCAVHTIEGLTDSGEIADLQEAFAQCNGAQCGFCTSGMLMTAQALLQTEPSPTRERIREYLSGNYCRCTGYQAIIDSVELAAKGRAGKDRAT